VQRLSSVWREDCKFGHPAVPGISRWKSGKHGMIRKGGNRLSVRDKRECVCAEIMLMQTDENMFLVHPIGTCSGGRRTRRAMAWQGPGVAVAPGQLSLKGLGKGGKTRQE
jgi:hypothetical protein